jgi:thiosulfate/3-mercaptopyruvate sulfurtransferase
LAPKRTRRSINEKERDGVVVKYIKEKEWLFEQLSKKNSITILDCRFSLKDPTEGLKKYSDDHIPGAIYVDLEKELSAPVGVHGGRHPLPDETTLKEMFEQKGVDSTVPVIVYDDGMSAFAARCWWMLTYLGHPQVYVLNGGYNAWRKANLPITKDVPQPIRGSFDVHVQPQLLATFEEVKDVVNTKGHPTTLIDSRAKERYLGEVEPIDKKAGHIPKAVNIDWQTGVKNDRLKPVEEQQKRFSIWKKNDPLIVYCGSGVTATVNVLSLLEAGYQNVKLYVGSFSDWISYDTNEVETKKNR